jgi:hypothetical protein
LKNQEIKKFMFYCRCWERYLCFCSGGGLIWHYPRPDKPFQIDSWPQPEAQIGSIIVDGKISRPSNLGLFRCGWDLETMAKCKLNCLGRGNILITAQVEVPKNQKLRIASLLEWIPSNLIRKPL